jgi:hypothetical protein
MSRASNTCKNRAAAFVFVIVIAYHVPGPVFTTADACNRAEP